MTKSTRTFAKEYHSKSVVNKTYEITFTFARGVGTLRLPAKDEKSAIKKFPKEYHRQFFIKEEKIQLEPKFISIREIRDNILSTINTGKF